MLNRILGPNLTGFFLIQEIAVTFCKRLNVADLCDV